MANVNNMPSKLSIALYEAVHFVVNYRLEEFWACRVTIEPDEEEGSLGHFMPLDGLDFYPHMLKRIRS